MSEHTRTGPYEDGTYRYRGWTLVLWENCNVATRTAGLGSCSRHAAGEPLWVAIPSFEGTLADFRRIGSEARIVANGVKYPSLARHVAGDADFSNPTIEGLIDTWEAGRERLFREAFAQAVREP